MKPPPFIPFGGPALQTGKMIDADIVVLPLCYEDRPSYGAGSKEGPLHLLMASEQMEMFDEEFMVEWDLLRIHTAPPLFPEGDPEKAVVEMETAAQEVLNCGKFLLSLGGDHAVSIGPIRAASKIYQDLGILQIDAHLDLRDQWNGSRYNHACVMRRVYEDGCRNIVQVGIRSFSGEEWQFVRHERLQPFFMHEMAAKGGEWVKEVLARLPEHVYLTVDLDGLDPSVIPGTGTPEPGGLSYRALIALIRQVADCKKIVAADVNELAKMEGTQVSEYTAARIAQKIILYTAFR